MTKRHKDFGSGKAPEEFEELSFTLGGEDFKCKTAVQGAVLLKFVADADSKDGGRSAEALYNFFLRCMAEDEYKRFMLLLESDDQFFDLADIGEIAGWLIEQYTERPTKRPKPSSPGRRSSARGSTAKPSATASASKS